MGRLTPKKPYDHNSHMKKTNVSTLKAKLSQYLEYVKHGGRVQIFDRETFVAELVPVYQSRPQKVADQKDEDEARLAELERKGIIRRPDPVKAKAALAWLKRHPLKPGKSAGVLQALLEEREEGR